MVMHVRDEDRSGRVGGGDDSPVSLSALLRRTLLAIAAGIVVLVAGIGFFAPLGRQVWVGGTLVVALVVTSVLVLALLWMRRDRLHLQGQLALERERQVLAARVAEERERLLVTLRSIGDGLVATDARGNVTLWNEVAERLTGWSSEEAVGRPAGEVFQVVNELTRQPCENPVTKVLESGRAVRLANHTALISRSGSECSIAESGAPIRTAAGDILGVVLVFRDVSEHKRAEEERDITLALLRKLSDSPDLAHLLQECVSYLKTVSGCDAVAIRLQDGQDYPYAVTSGFSDEFVRAESRLRARDPATVQGGDGACLDCWCGRVICGDLAGSPPFLTAKGSFRCGSIAAARAAQAPGNGARFRYRCQEAGYESVALLALPAASGTLGLLQFNDRRQEFFSPDTVEMLERLAACVAIAVSQKWLQAELEGSEERFRHATLGAPFPIMIHAADGEVLTLNHSWARLSGYGREDVALVRDWMRLALGESTDESKPAQESAASAAIPDGEFEIRTRSGELRTWSFSSASLGPLADGRPSFITMATDVTGQREAESRLRQSEKLESIGLLAGGVAHDFNNQLAAIQGYADLLASALVEPRLRGYAENILRASHRSADLTRQLLAFARKGSFNPEPTDVHAVIHEVAALLERSIDKQIQITLRLEALRSMVSGDASQLQSALLNLSLNARDAMPGGGELRISTSVHEVAEEAAEGDLGPGTYVQVCVSDTGAGMTDDVMRRIFQPFFTTKELGRGTGLGLAAVYGTVKRHGGSIRARSEVGRGTTFSVYLRPLDGQGRAPSHETPVAVPAGHRSLCRSSIVVVDDEEMVRTYVADVLSSQGYQVATCVNGREAVDLYRKSWQGIDLVILDAVMPVMGGRDAFKAMRGINPGLVAILCSGYSRDDQACGVLDDGIVDFLPKPFESRRLLERVAAALLLARDGHCG